MGTLKTKPKSRPKPQPRMNMSIVFLNQAYMNDEDAKISPFDRGFLFAQSVYEVAPIVKGKIGFFKELKTRLANSLNALGITHKSCSIEELEPMFYELISKNKLQEGGLYLQISTGLPGMKRDFPTPKDIAPTIFAYVYPCEVLSLKPEIDVVFLPEIRWQRRDVKTTNLLAQVMTKDLAQAQGADEAFFVERGFITEASSANAYIIKNGVLFTKPLSNEILPGLRRIWVLEIAKSLGLEVREEAFTPQMAKEADECFISAATILLVAVKSIEAVSLPSQKPYFHKLREAMAARLIKECD